MGNTNFLVWTLLALISHLYADIKINILMLITTTSYSGEKKAKCYSDFGIFWFQMKAYDCIVGQQSKEE